QQLGLGVGPAAPGGWSQPRPADLDSAVLGAQRAEARAADRVTRARRDRRVVLPGATGCRLQAIVEPLVEACRARRWVEWPPLPDLFEPASVKEAGTVFLRQRLQPHEAPSPDDVELPMHVTSLGIPSEQSG